MSSGSQLRVTEYTDPGCIWSWSSEPALRWLRLALSDRCSWRRVFGVQIGDLSSSRPDYATTAVAEEYRRSWLETARRTGAPAPLRVAHLHRSTRPASTAAKAAELQGEAIADAVLRRLREAFFVDGEPPEDDRSISGALAGVPGLDLARLRFDWRSPEVGAALARDVAETRELPKRAEDEGVVVHAPDGLRPDGDLVRFAFPSLLFEGPRQAVLLAGWHTRDEYISALALAGVVENVLEFAGLPASELLARFGTLTVPELELLSLEGAPPPDAVVRLSASGPLYASTEEQRGHEGSGSRARIP